MKEITTIIPKGRKTVKLSILKEDYKGLNTDMGSYCGLNGGCLLVRAARRQFQTDNVSEEVEDIKIDNKVYKHRPFYCTEFKKCVEEKREFSIILRKS